MKGMAQMHIAENGKETHTLLVSFLKLTTRVCNGHFLQGETFSSSEGKMFAPLSPFILRMIKYLALLFFLMLNVAKF